MGLIKYKNLNNNGMLSDNRLRFCNQLAEKHKLRKITTVERLVEIITSFIDRESSTIRLEILQQSNLLRSQGLKSFSEQELQRKHNELLLQSLDFISRKRHSDCSNDIENLKERNRYSEPLLYLSGRTEASNNISFFIDIEQRFPKNYKMSQINSLFNETFDHIIDATKRSLSGGMNSITEEALESYHEKHNPKVRIEIAEAANRELAINSGQFSNQHINAENVPPIRNKRSNNSTTDNINNDNRKRVRWADYVTQEQTESRNNDRSI